MKKEKESTKKPTKAEKESVARLVDELFSNPNLTFTKGKK
jgi:hypothetical protein